MRPGEPTHHTQPVRWWRVDVNDWKSASVRIEPPSPDRTPAMWLEVTPREEWTP